MKGDNACGLCQKELVWVLKIQDARIPQEIYAINALLDTIKGMMVFVGKSMIYVRVGTMPNV